ncbi:phage major capsid protein, partial [Bacillus thuringiensis]|nr:phage major capsid protein [Bacillus thuringiensis]
SVGLELVFVIGTCKDKNEPIGLLKNPIGSVVGGVYPDNKTAGILTFATGRKTINELKGVVQLLAQKLNPDVKTDAD